MSQTFPRNPATKSHAVLGALAAVATLGAVQLAFGHDLADRFQALSEPRDVVVAVNRAGKSDREANVPQAAGQSRTIQLRVDSLADTSVLVRIPVQQEARNLPPARPAPKPAGDKAKRMTVACEPVVSVLTEVAKLLQPGKCVT